MSFSGNYPIQLPLLAAVWEGQGVATYLYVGDIFAMLLGSKGSKYGHL